MTAPPRILVTGSTGNVGAALLQAARHRPGVADAAQWVAAAGLDFQRPDTFDAALAGVERVFLMRPPAIARVGRPFGAFVAAMRRHGVGHVAFLSVQGAERSTLVPHRRIELLLAAAGIPCTFLRPGYFMQNLNGALALGLARRGEIVLPAGAARFDWVDARDVGEAAAAILAAPSAHAGRAYTLCGPDRLDFHDVAALLAAAWARPVRYRPTGVARFLATALRDGMPPGRAAAMAFLHALPQPPAPAAAERAVLAALLGRPPCALARYAVEHGPPQV